MANRSYLYTADKDLTRLRDVSEWNYDVPLFHKIVMGVNAVITNSKIWDYEHPIAIKADFKQGLDRLLSFFDYLKTQKNIDQKLILQYENETKDFFRKHPEREGELFFLEAGEIFDMMGEPLKELTESLFQEINSISSDLIEILEKRPIDLFSYKNSYWLKELQKDSSQLEVYWTHVTYFSFNKSE